MDYDQIFKAYDIRGVYPTQLDEKAAGLVGIAYANVIKPKRIVVGGDARNSTPSLKKSLIESLISSGVDVVDIGTITTDQLYFAVGKFGFDGGISVTASHNPGEYNGFKFSEEGGKPITSNRLVNLKNIVRDGIKVDNAKPGKLTNQEILDDYIDHVLSFVNFEMMKPWQIVANANYGAVGRTMDKIADKLNLDLQRLNWEEDGSFPKGPPNPLLPSNREETIRVVKKVNPDIGVAWDADADRCFFYTGAGQFVPSCFIIAILAREFLKRFPGSKIIHDVTITRAIDDTVKANGGISVANRVGHTFMKARMREEDAPFAGESSGHYYFRDNFYADNGIIPFLMILEIISKTGSSLAELIAPFKKRYFVSDEMNFKVHDTAKSVEAIRQRLGTKGEVSNIDGLAVSSKGWRFNVRASNTEPLLRLNAEANSQDQLDRIVGKVTEIIKGF